jgi:hypothetical protein
MERILEFARKFWLPLLIVAIVAIVAMVWLFRIKLAAIPEEDQQDFRPGGTFGDPNLPRGMRNNNPGNLVLTMIPWRGKVPNYANTDGKFEQFTDYHWGIRAMLLDLRSDINKGKNTIRKLIYEYAPPFENNTASYINNLASATGIGADEVITFNQSTMRPIAKQIARIENGRDAITDSQFNYAWSLI